MGLLHFVDHRVRSDQREARAEQSSENTKDPERGEDHPPVARDAVVQLERQEDHRAKQERNEKGHGHKQGDLLPPAVVGHGVQDEVQVEGGLLLRKRLGDAVGVEEVVPLLGSSRAPRRACLCVGVRQHVVGLLDDVVLGNDENWRPILCAARWGRSSGGPGP